MAFDLSCVRLCNSAARINCLGRISGRREWSPTPGKATATLHDHNPTWSKRSRRRTAVRVYSFFGRLLFMEFYGRRACRTYVRRPRTGCTGHGGIARAQTKRKTLGEAKVSLSSGCITSFGRVEVRLSQVKRCERLSGKWFSAFFGPSQRISTD